MHNYKHISFLSLSAQSFSLAGHFMFIVQANCHRQYPVKHIVVSVLVFPYTGITIVRTVRR